MQRCFVIQPFDGGKFDKRYNDVLVPAIASAGLEAYRVDQDPTVSIPIEDIQNGIETSSVCLADISTDNPNVWFELGYAFARRREVVLICSNERTSNFPFDVQHRAIIKYIAESPSDFDELKKKIKARIRAIIDGKEILDTVSRMSSIATVKGLEPFEFATLVAVAQRVDNHPSARQIQDELEHAGFTQIATTLAIGSLLNRGFIETNEESGWNETYLAYSVSNDGIEWLRSNIHLLELRKEIPEPKVRTYDEDEPPF